MAETKVRRKSLTLDELIDALVQVRLKSPLKGETVPHICIPDHEYQPINAVKLTDADAGDEDNPSGIALIFSDSLEDVVENLMDDAVLGDPTINLGPADDYDPRDGLDLNGEIDEAPEHEV